jgi:hypothetical protein
MLPKKDHPPQRQTAKRHGKPKLTNHIPRTRCSEHDRAVIEDKANKAGLKLGEYIRAMCVQGVVTVRTSVLDVTMVKLLTKLGFELNAIGNNLNQLVTKAHIHNEVERQRLFVILKSIENLLHKIDAVLMKVVSNDP